MNYDQYKDIQKRANEVAFALAKIVNNFADVLGTTGLKEYLTKGDLLNLLEYREEKEKITLKPNYRALIFDALSRAEYGKTIQTRQSEIAKAVRDKIKIDNN